MSRVALFAAAGKKIVNLSVNETIRRIELLGTNQGGMSKG
jgi:hypothetical protein